MANKQSKRTAKFQAKQRHQAKTQAHKKKKKIIKKKGPTETTVKTTKNTVVDNASSSLDKKSLSALELSEMDMDTFLNTDFMDVKDEESEIDEMSDSGSESSRSSSDSEDDENDLESEQLQDDQHMDSEEEEAASAEPISEPEAMSHSKLTMEELKSLETRAFKQHSVKSLRQLMRIFSKACKQDNKKDAGDNDQYSKQQTFESSAVYNRLMVSMFRHTHRAISFHSSKDNNKSKSNSKKQSPVSIKVAPVVRQFISSTISLLQQLAEPEIQMFILRELAFYLPFLQDFSKLAKRLLQILILKWSTTTAEEKEPVVMMSFLRIRDLAQLMMRDGSATTSSFLESSLKALYLSYYRNTKFTTEATYRHQIVLGNCVVELYGIDMVSSYQHAFIYIRQLALALRRCQSGQTLESVLNWQFANALKLWTAVLCAYPTSELKTLIYPLSQVLLGTLHQASASSKYFPLRLLCIELCQKLSLASSTFLPTAPALLDILQSSDLVPPHQKKKQPKSSTPTKPLELHLHVKFSKSILASVGMHDVVFSRTMALLSAEIGLYQYQIGFPEMSTPILSSLKHVLTHVKIPKWTTMVKGLIQTIQKRGKYIQAKRMNVEFGPKDADQVRGFLNAEKQEYRMQRMKKNSHAESLNATTVTSKSVKSSDKVALTKKQQQPQVQQAKKEEEASPTAVVNVDDMEDEEDIVEDMAWSSSEEEDAGDSD